MLNKLSIKNYILIHELEIEFSGGLSVITGETGAGKSILLGALGLILGQRADSGILLDASQKCVVEGSFLIAGYNLEELFRLNDLDYDDSVILRREINQGGKSRAFINDTPVNLSLLKDLGDRLVNIHSQNSITTLNDSNFQLAVIDSYAGIQSNVTAYRSEYFRMADLKKQLAELQNTLTQASLERDYNQFLLDELEQANLKAGELTELEEQHALLTHAGEIKSNLFAAAQLISGGEENILEQVTLAIHTLDTVAKFKNDLKVLVDRLKSNYIDIKDIVNEISVLEEQIFVDPGNLEILTQRLDLLNRLLKKHHVTTIGDLMQIKDKIEKKVVDVVDLENRIHSLSTELKATESLLFAKAKEISARRRKVFQKFEQEITQLLSKLGIATAQFKIESLEAESLSRDGLDKVRFLFSANKGIEIRDLNHTASGGELSRIMLGIKSMISQKNLLPTIVFDEIDNGVSGEVAGKVGSILHKMGTGLQVIAITHLPQIAGKGDQHYWVYKTELKQGTTTYIKKLSENERVVEIAKMLSNEVVTESAVKTANELLGN
ncbi:MAG: DNA repair protein RecN [Bacteroidota bacterium]